METKCVDVHCHLTFDRFDEDREEVIERMREKGVVGICSGVSPKINREVLKLSRKYPDVVKASFGIYPVDAVADMLADVSDDVARHIEIFDVDAELTWIKEHKEDMTAIGEVGLDYMMVTDEKAQAKQREIFRKIIRLARELNKPLVIHSRKGEADVLQILEEEKFNKVDMHCFSGKKSLIKKGVEMGLYFSVPSVITRLEHFKNLVGIVPLNQLLTETDAPYLAPVAGGRSEPKDVINTVKEIAKIKEMGEEEVREQIFNNARKLFNL